MMPNAFATLIQPLRRYADFRGRSTRTDLALLWALTILLTLPLLVAEIVGVLSIEGRRIADSVLVLLILCPSVALLVRRLHDQGRSGWWLLVGVPALSVSLAQQWQRLSPSIDLDAMRISSSVGIAGAISALIVLILVLLPGEPGANRFGPNPRRGHTTEAPRLSS